MKSVWLMGLMMALMGAQGLAQEEMRARGDFLKSRESSGSRPSTTPGSSVSKPKTKPPVKPAGKGNANQLALSPVGLGYTVFLKDKNDQWVRVSPQQRFVSGNQIRLLLETNINGYLYIFHQENQGRTELLFPHSQIQNGNNQIKANQPLLVPAGTAWRFNEQPAIENLTFIVSRQPLPGIPTGAALNRLAKFAPPAEVLEQIARATAPLEDRIADEGTVMTTEENRRGIELVASDPAPTSIFLNRTAREDRVVVKLKLVHQ